MQNTQIWHPRRQPTRVWASRSPSARPGPKGLFSCLPMACHFCLTSYFFVLLLPWYKQLWIYMQHLCCTGCMHMRQVHVPWHLISAQRHRRTLRAAIQDVERGIKNAGMHFVSCQSLPGKGSTIVFVSSAFCGKLSV